jgi:hypothetical protein
MGEQASERAGQARQQEAPGGGAGGLSLLLIRWGLLTVQEPIGKEQDTNSEGESRDVENGAPSAHHVHRVAGDDEERDDEGRSGKNDDPGEDCGDGAKCVHCVAPFVAGTSGDKDSMPNRSGYVKYLPENTCQRVLASTNTHSIHARFPAVSAGRASERASVSGTTVVGAMFTYSGVLQKQGSIHGVCVKVLGFFGFGR